MITTATQWLQNTDGLFGLILSWSLSLLMASLLLIGGYILSSIASRRLADWLARVENFDGTLIPVLRQLVRYVIMIFTLILVLSEFGVQTTSVIAVLGAAGLAIGLALQGTLQNVASGIMILILRPFQVGDYIEAGGVSGSVDEIGLFMTRMHTSQNLFIAIPNSKIFGNTIINYSRFPRRRLDLLVGISYDDDIDQAIEIIRQLAVDERRIYKKPEPDVFVKNLADSAVELELRAWTSRQNHWPVKFALTRAVKYALDDAGISIPYPHRQIVINTPEPVTSQSAAADKKPDQ